MPVYSELNIKDDDKRQVRAEKKRIAGNLL